MTTIELIKQRLAEIGGSVPGVTRAYAEAPQALPPADLPLMLVLAGGVSGFTVLGETLAEENRNFKLRLYVAPIGQGYDGDAEKQVEPFLTEVRDTFVAHPALGNSLAGGVIPFVEKMTWLGDSGIAVVPFGGENFLGAEFNVSVRTVVPLRITQFE